MSCLLNSVIKTYRKIDNAKQLLPASAMETTGISASAFNRV
jgi:hypothetical protein